MIMKAIPDAPLQSPRHITLLVQAYYQRSSLPKLPELSREMVAQLEAQTDAMPVSGQSMHDERLRVGAMIL